MKSSLLPPGIGLYPTGALINHSCTPNAVQTFEGPTIQFIALAPIAPGKPPDVTLSGVPTHAEQGTASCTACQALPPPAGHACWPPKQCASGLGHCCPVSDEAAQLAASRLKRRPLYQTTHTGAGAEITIAYTELAATRQERRDFMFTNYHFDIDPKWPVRA